MRSRRHAIAVLLGAWLAALAAAAPAHADGRRAFVVGINAYPQLGPDAQLRRAGNDAQAVGDALAQIGFTVTRVTQGAELAPLLSRFGEFLTTVSPGDTVVFFYAGHGISLDDGTFLLPSDVPALKPSDELLAKRVTLSEREISTRLRGTGARAALVVLDACRNNPFPPRGTRAIGNSMQGLTRMTAADGVFTLYSAREGQTALDGLPDDEGRNSVFTRVFVETLKKPGISISELGETVRDEVAMLARSAGHDQVPAVYNDLIGARKLYLAGPPPEAVVVAKPEARQEPSQWAPTVNPVASPSAQPRPETIPQAVAQRPVEPAPAGPMPDWCVHGSPKTRIERAICADPALGRSDVTLNRAYVARAAALTGPARLRFVQESRDWIRERDARCGGGGDLAVRACLLAAIEERIEAVASPGRRVEAAPPEQPDWCSGGGHKNQVERVICADPELSRWDIRLNRLYAVRSARLSGSARIRFVQESREWILERNVRCGSGSVSVMRNCLLTAVERRAREIGP